MARALEQAAGPLMFDADQRAAVMRQLFEKKVASTRALLESAESGRGGQTVRFTRGRGSGGVLEREGGDRAEGRGRQQKAEPARKEPPPKKAAPPPASPRPPNSELGGANAPHRVPTEVDSEARPTVTQAPATTRMAPAAPTENKTLNTVLWAAVLTAIVVGGSYLVMTLTRTLDADVKPEPTLQTYQDPRLKPFPEPGLPVDPAGQTDGGVPGSATAAADPKDKDKDDDKPSKPRGPQGKMTLIINPEAEVFLGKRSLGKTPLFNTTLPVGTHLLRIVGPDKKARMLSVPIEAGKTAMHRFALKDIPEAH